MSFDQVSNAFDLLGLNEKPLVPLRVLESSHEGQPQFEIAWGDFRGSVWSSVRSVASWPLIPGKFWGTRYFRDCWVERRVPYRAIFAATLWHVVFLVMPFPELGLTLRRNPAFDNTILTWSGPIDDLPLLNIPGGKSKPTPRGDIAKPLPREGADAFHPRQRIITDPVHPTHPRQTLINSAAPPEPPKILPNLPNVVQLQQSAGPARPRLQISEQTLAKLRPKERRVATLTTTPLPDIAPANQTPAEITMQLSPNAPARPKLVLNAGTAPRLAERVQSGEVGPAPDMAPSQPNSPTGSTSTFIALSATPGPAAPAGQPPLGNLSARVTISPKGKQPGSPGGSPSAPVSDGGSGGTSDSRGWAGAIGGASKNSTAVSISGGNPSPKSSISGLGGGKISAPILHSAPSAQPTSGVGNDDIPVGTGPPNFAALPPGAQPEQALVSKKVYKLLVNMPNLNSATGSWVLNFSELRVDPNAPPTSLGELSTPEPLRKTDPKYPRTLAEERIEGEVILYAVIRKDGTVDSIQLVRGVDERLDVYAMQALGQWKFQPATREGVPVDLEAIVHIPFHAPSH